MAECIKKNVILDACINEKGDIFKEVRKLRKTVPTVSSMIDGIQVTLKLILLMSTRTSTTQLMTKIT